MSPGGMPADEELAARLKAAQLSLDSLHADADVRIRLQRRLMAICDAMKIPGVNHARCASRLEQFAEEVDRVMAGGR